MVTEAAMQQVNEPHARLPRDEERDAAVRVSRGQGTAPARHPALREVNSGNHALLKSWLLIMSTHCHNLTEDHQ